ncbi:hypothetical protein [Micromonospora rifamycinica]|uniref:hypothetical protein n=1 Tax=Micromonospora rifamycinica TaxID=291594 RepID=UPI0012F9E0FE|nr:hypothetical protein [Micromonospora rifamycinica]
MRSSRRMVLLVTGALVAVLALSFVVLRADTADLVATAVSAVAAVAGVGVALWAALAPTRPGLRAEKTGRVTTTRHGYGVSGIDAPADDDTPMSASATGDVETDGGVGISGIHRRPR